MAGFDLTGQRFSRLVALQRAASRNGARWLCECDCGNKKIVAAGNLRCGGTQSCGCFLKERYAHTKHGQSWAPGKPASRLYRIWHGMRGRCNNSADAAYDRYGGRGILICEEWQDFLKFEEWAHANGYADNLSVDRIDNDGPYSPANCRWATSKTQGRNRRNNLFVTFRGKTACLADHADDVGIKYSIVQQRVSVLGWPVERALTTPHRKVSA